MSTLPYSIRMEELFNIDLFLYRQLPKLQKVFPTEGSVLLSPCVTVLAIIRRDIYFLLCLWVWFKWRDKFENKINVYRSYISVYLYQAYIYIKLTFFFISSINLEVEYKWYFSVHKISDLFEIIKCLPKRKHLKTQIFSFSKERCIWGRK